MIAADFVQQLRAPWGQAQGFLITQLERWQASLAHVFTLMSGLESRLDRTATLGSTGFPVSAVLTTDTLGVTGFSQVRPCPLGFTADAIITPSALSASVNNYDPPFLANAAVVRLGNGGAYNITGLVAPQQSAMRLLVNIGANTITLKHQSASSVAQNRFTGAGAADVSLTTGRAVWIWYDLTGSTWQIVG